MRRIVLIFTVLLFGMQVFAQDVVLNGELRFDWVDMSQIQRDSTIDYYRDKLFDDETVNFSRKEFNQKYAQFLRDEDYKEHYRLAKMGQKETNDANLCAFFFKKDLLLIYAIQYKNNPKRVYYYNAYGHLQYVDEISDEYPEFPYRSKQYRRNGKLISAIYFTSSDMQYMYEPDGKFKGLWYKEQMYDRKGQKAVKRTNWGI